MKKFSVLAAIFFLIFSLTTPNFVSAEESDLEALEQYNDEYIARAENYINKVIQTAPHKKKYKSKQRPILIEGAMNIEIEKFVRALKNPVVYNFSNYLFVAGTYKNYPVVVLRTEQGLANAAASTVIGIKEFNPIAVINLVRTFQICILMILLLAKNQLTLRLILLNMRPKARELI